MKILVDTSVYVEFMKKGDSHLSILLEEDRVINHPYVLSEILLGGSINNKILHSLLFNLPQVTPAEIKTLDAWIQSAKVYQYGIGLVDASILFSAAHLKLKIFTRDRKLQTASKKLGVAAEF